MDLPEWVARLSPTRSPGWIRNDTSLIASFALGVPSRYV